MTTGIRLFASYHEIPISTIDSSFFHHAHHEKGMCLILTDEKSLYESGVEVEWKNDSQIKVRKTVPVERFSIINISVPDGKIKSREDRMSLERTMLEALCTHLQRYSPGKKIFL
jgi:flagellar assembly factor FliW